MSSTVDDPQLDNEEEKETNPQVNGDLCRTNDGIDTENCTDLPQVVSEETQAVLDEVQNDKTLISQTNGLKNENQDVQLVLTEYEHVKDELMKLQAEYQSSIQRERNLCEKLQNFHTEEDNKVSKLSKVNEDLREQLNNVLEELNGKKGELKNVNSTLDSTQKERDKLSTELAKLHIERLEERDGLKEKVKSLDEVNNKLEDELETVKGKMQAHDSAAKRAINAIQKEMALRVDQVTKMYEDALKDKENAVLKMTQLEEDKKKIFVEKELLAGKFIDNNKENEKLRQKIKDTTGDLAKAQASLEEKEKEVLPLQKELTKLKEEINSQAVKVKWAQNRLKNELEAHKETKTKLSQTTQKLKEAREEGEMIRSNCQALIKKYQESEEMKSSSLDQKLKEKEDELKKNEQEIADQDEIYRVKVQELVNLRNEQRIYVEEIKDLKAKVILLEEKITLYAVKIAEHEKNELAQKSEIQTLKKELQEVNEFKTKYESEVQTVAKLTEEKERQQKYIHDLESDISGGTSNQSELLEFTEKLTAKNAQLQSEVTSIQTMCESVQKEKNNLEEHLEEIKKQKSTLESQYKEEITSLQKNLEQLTIIVQEKSKAVEQLSLSLEDAKDELQVTRRKNNASIKDLTRQLQQSRKLVDKLESNHHGSKESLDDDSKSSSTSSLDKLSANGSSPVVVNNPAMSACVTDSGMPPNHDAVQIVQPINPPMRTGTEIEPSKKLLVDKICRLQKIHAKKNEKLEFMEEHINALVDEIQKKTRIIQYYTLREESGALAPPMSDLNKARLSRHGGIMASLYSSKPLDSDMTMELSLQINKKLQAVLEDTILKNITLKENLDTLGDEISRLNEELTAYKRRR
ncbi:coiled-coil domain-containing protein 186-like [Actinia tenebrosa]|uniref:Coiled-coil domain-containing protein 186-like n=1 Tax=Actinia tenebrosa TaxID=6105 RepID=A0A6P8IPI5_ACTTE|nr:coiled-coil domain-containing protein 186-like [Actinia tenebrosa]